MQKGKQKELIERAKGKLSWKELATSVALNQHYLSNELRKEKRFLPKRVYDLLCVKAESNYDTSISALAPDNWGQSKGGRSSNGGYTKKITVPENSNELAEFYGIMLGDGNLTKIRGYKIGTYQARIVGDSRNDYDHLVNYIKPLVEKLFTIEVGGWKEKKANAFVLNMTSRKLTEFLESKGFKAGNKIKSQVTIPEWIKKNPEFLKACLRGLIDTDGCVHAMSKRDSNLGSSSFKNYNKTLLEDARKSFIQLGFNPSKIILEKTFYLSRQEEIKKYLKEIGFSNPKHLRRLNAIKAP